MAKMFPCERVDVGFAETAPYRFSNRVDLAITPEQLFEVLADAESWPRWARVITNVTWTSPEPHGVGTTRTVDMRGGIIGDEEYLVWEPLTRMAFRFNECSRKAVAAFAEYYRVEIIPGGCRMTWTLAQKPTGPAKLVMFVVRPLLNPAFRRFLGNLRRYTDKRFAATPPGLASDTE
jgi:Polyketide cyclase / dehydrase and lipid transport